MFAYVHSTAKGVTLTVHRQAILCGKTRRFSEVELLQRVQMYIFADKF